MIAVWSNGWDGSSHELVFVDVVDSPGMRTMSHCVALLRLIDKIGAAKQAVVASAQDMQFSQALRPVPLRTWIRDAFQGALELRDGVDSRELERLLTAMPDWALVAADLWHVSNLGPRISRRRPHP